MLLYSVPLISWQATVDPHLRCRLPDTHRLVWLSLLWGHCSFLLGPCPHKVLFVPSKSLFPQSCGNSVIKSHQPPKSGSLGVLICSVANGDLLQEGLCHTLNCCIQSPCTCGRPLLTLTSTGDTQTLQGRSGSVSVGSSGVHKVLFEPSERLWQVWSLILNTISPLLSSCQGFSFALGHGVSFFGGIQNTPVDCCSAASCDFGVLTGEEKRMSFYSAIKQCNPLY